MSRTALLFAFSIILLGASICAYVILLREVNVAIVEIASAEGSIVSAGKRAALARSTDLFIADTASEREELGVFVAQDEEIVDVIEAIEAEARRNKVSVVISSVTQEENGWKRHGLVRLGLSGEGAFAALGTFIAALEQLPFASRLADVSLEPLEEKSWYGTFTVLVVTSNTP